MSLESDAIEVLGASPLGRATNIDDLISYKLDSTVITSQYSRVKIIISGNTIEKYAYEVPLKTGVTKKSKGEKTRKKDRSGEYKSRSIFRAKNRIRRLCLSNFEENDKFVTLTFNNEQKFDITDISICLVYFKKFIRKLHAMYPDFKYIAVPEFQKRGAVHYHLLCNLPYIENSELAKLWGYGFINIKAVEHSKNVSIYITKYLSKRLEDLRKNGHRLYYSPKNLIKPRTIYGDVAEQLSERLIKSTKIKKTFENNYITALNGRVYYTQYNRIPNEST